MQHPPDRAPRRRPRLSWAAIPLVASILVGLHAAAAEVAVAEETTVTWSVTPADESGPDGRAWVELELDAGAQATEHLAVRNFSAEEVTFKLTAADGYFTDAGRFNMLPSDRESTGAGTWISVDEAVTVAPNGTVIVPFDVDVPEDATPGDHAAGIAASIFSVDDGAGGTRLGVESRVGFRVMTRVTGELRPDLDVVDIAATYDTSWNPFEPGSVDVDATMANSGNVRLDTTVSALTGEVRVPDPADAEASRPVELLPGDERRLAIELPDVWPLGFSIVRVEVASEAIGIDGSKHAIQPEVREVLVWTMPWPHLMIALAVALLIGGLLWGRRRRALEIDRLVREAEEKGRRSVLVTASAGERDG